MNDVNGTECYDHQQQLGADQTSTKPRNRVDVEQ